MKLSADADTTRWLEELLDTDDFFDWDEGNATKNRKHDVEVDDVESLFENAFLFEDTSSNLRMTSRGGSCSDAIECNDHSL